MAAILDLKKMPMDEILHTLWKMFPGTPKNWYQSTKKVCTTFPPEVRFLPDYRAPALAYKLPDTNKKGTALKTFTFSFFKTMWFSKINLNLGTNRQ